MGMRCPRAWLRKPCPGRPVEKAPEPTKGLRMKSVASAPKGQGVITLAGRRGRGPHRINAAVERRKADRLRKAGACFAKHAVATYAPFTALRSLFGSQDALSAFVGSANRKQNKNSRGIFPAARTKRRVDLRTGLFDNLIGTRRVAPKPQVRFSIFVMAGSSPAMMV